MTAIQPMTTNDQPCCDPDWSDHSGAECDCTEPRKTCAESADAKCFAAKRLEAIVHGGLADPVPGRPTCKDDQRAMGLLDLFKKPPAIENLTEGQYPSGSYSAHGCSTMLPFTWPSASSLWAAPAWLSGSVRSSNGLIRPTRTCSSPQLKSSISLAIEPRSVF